MSESRDKYYKFKLEADAYFGGLQNDITDYVNELKRENTTLKLKQGQCLKCTAKHKEELFKLKQQNKEMYKQFTIDKYLKRIEYAKKRKKEKVSLAEEDSIPEALWISITNCGYCIKNSRDCDNCELGNNVPCCDGLIVKLMYATSWNEYIRYCKKIIKYVEAHG